MNTVRDASRAHNMRLQVVSRIQGAMFRNSSGGNGVVRHVSFDGVHRPSDSERENAVLLGQNVELIISVTTATQ